VAVAPAVAAILRVAAKVAVGMVVVMAGKRSLWPPHGKAPH
jgi:hypothetical protein